MRWLVAVVLFLLALGTLRVVGCGDEGFQCLKDEDCDDQNECTDDMCHSLSGRCSHIRVLLYDRQKCDFDGLAGVCVDGICIEDLCAGDPCDDDNECTYDECYFRDGSCRHWDRYPPDCDWGGVPGRCLDGICIEDLCAGDPCDDDNECTRDQCNFSDGSCGHWDWYATRDCDWGGVPGICLDGVCEENPCNSIVCDDGDLCTDDTCRPTEGECTDDTCAWDGTCFFEEVDCNDRNSCTRDTCDPETGECNYMPTDGSHCCLRYDWCCDSFVCFSPDWCCVEYGDCQDGECV